MKIVVTGGTGFLGSQLVGRLQEKNAGEIVIVSRSLGFDIARPETLRGAFQGAQTVFHLAALVQSRPGPFEETNVNGLRNVLEASLETEVERVVCISSFTAFGPSSGAPHSEVSLCERTSFYHGYDRTKYEALKIAQRWKEKLPVNIVFPTVIYGPGKLTEGNIMVRLFQRWLRMRMAPLPVGGRPVWNFVFVEDVVDGLLRVLNAPPGEDFILGGNNCSLLALCEAVSRVSGRKIRALALSPNLFKWSSYLEDWASRLGRFQPLVVPSTAAFFLEDWEFSSEKAFRQLEYVPRALEDGLESTLSWMKRKHLI